MCKTRNQGKGRTIVTISLRQSAVCRMGPSVEKRMQSSDDSIVAKKEIFRSRKYELKQLYYVNPVNLLSLVPDLIEATDSDNCQQPG